MHRHRRPWPILRIGDETDPDQDRVGVKAWYLHELDHAGFPTAPAFCVEVGAYIDAIRIARVDRRLQTIWDAARDADMAEIAMMSRRARHLVSEIEFGRGVHEQLEAHLADLRGRSPVLPSTDRAAVAVRSSTTPSAATGPECAGLHASYLDVMGVDRVVGRIHACWASLFSEPALTLRAHGFGGDQPSMGVVVQTMIHAAKSGIVTPTGGTTEMLVEATFGIGEPIIAGAVEPDRYVVNRIDHTLRSLTVGRKQIVLPETVDVDGRRAASSDHRDLRVLSDDELRELSALSRAVDVRFGGPHEVEWAIDDHSLYVIQARQVSPGHRVDEPIVDRRVSGIGIGMEWATGRIRVVDRYEELGELQESEVLVAAETTPEWSLRELGRCAAIVVDEGDAACHAAQVARGLGIPAIVGTGDATNKLETGTPVTVDASRGWVIPSVTFATTV